ncbi:hypothetical protein IFM89_037620 [Coptis chinensis]|uniref:KIB1-4 beta-propeller domain-containing protein n=1 Tax=Coptis chinensis TaxID=261450 RepID=A0A835J075_9MAGN|nr:hypothetical protein IFM89_037620 [Coptis chinensis]
MDWSDIADYLLDEIVVRLDSYSDYVRLRAVCPVWKSSLPKIPKYLPLTLPGLMLPCNHTDSEVFNLFFAASEVHKLKLAKTEQWLWKGSSKGWLVQLENSPSINLINPLTSTRMQLPPLTTFPNVLEYIPERIGAEYSVMTVNMREEEIRFFSLAEMKHFCVKKLVLSSSPRGKNCLAMAIYGDRDELAWCRIGDEGWKTVEGGWCFFDDIIHFDGKFYALDYIGRVIILPDEEVGASCPKATLFASPPNPDRPDFISDYFYLVESSGQLLM